MANTFIVYRKDDGEILTATVPAKNASFSPDALFDDHVQRLGIEKAELNWVYLTDYDFYVDNPERGIYYIGTSGTKPVITKKPVTVFKIKVQGGVKIGERRYAAQRGSEVPLEVQALDENNILKPTVCNLKMKCDRGILQETDVPLDGSTHQQVWSAPNETITCKIDLETDLNFLEYRVESMRIDLTN